MEFVKRGIRLLAIVLLLILAVFGIGLTGNFLNTTRERYMGREIKTEQVERKEEDDEENKTIT